MSAITMSTEQFRAYRAQRDAEMTDKRGKSFARKYWQAVDRLFSPSKVVEYRTNGVVVESVNGYELQVLADTDSHHSRWRVGAVIDVTDQFAEVAA